MIFIVSWSSQNFATSWLISNYAIFTPTVTQSPETFCGDSFGLCSLLDFPDPLFSAFLSLCSFSSHEGHVLWVFWDSFHPVQSQQTNCLATAEMDSVSKCKDSIWCGLVLFGKSFLNFCPESCCLPWRGPSVTAVSSEGGTGRRLPSADVHLSFHDHGRYSSTKEKRSPKHVMVLLDD